MSTTDGKRPYAARMAPEQRREQLLDTVLRVIAEQGVHKVSIDVVAREAGVTRPVVYAHFADSDALLRASLDREEAGALDQLLGVLPDGSTPGSAADIAVATFERFLAAVLAAPDRWRAILMVADSNTPAFRARLERGRADAVAAIETGLRRAGVEGDLAVLARLLYAVVLEAGRLVLAEPDAFPPTRLREFAAQHLRRLLPA